MFTGIIQSVGQVVALEGSRLLVRADPSAWPDGIRLGESICVNGCCLTVVHAGPPLAFELSDETLKRTTLGRLGQGALVNLERALLPTDRMGGHIVQGHVDGVGSLLNVVPGEGQHQFRFGVPEGYDRYLVDKASIAVDGISLTVVRPSAGAFDAFIVPHTFQNTNLRAMSVDQDVNIEFDILFKYVERIVSR